MMEKLVLTYKEYWGYYWRVTSRHLIPGIFKYDEQLVELIEKVCALKTDAEILDLGCAGGDQLKLLARKGYRVTGIDFVPSLIEYAKKTFEKEGLSGNLLVDDMRNIDYTNRFHLVTMLSGSFGYFSDVQNQEMLDKIHRALKPGGTAFIDYLPLEDFAARRPARTWHLIVGGYGLNEEWFDALTSTHRTRNIQILLDGRIIEGAVEEDGGANEALRCYTAREMETMASTAGFTVTAHLCRYHLENPGRKSLPGEPRGMIVLKKGVDNNA
jgi:2-polyprenyl-3-methyl-5-hydroxy-6-metoxy-1,4-benzoquinol methylase